MDFQVFATFEILSKNVALTGVFFPFMLSCYQKYPFYLLSNIKLKDILWGNLDAINYKFFN